MKLFQIWSKSANINLIPESDRKREKINRLENRVKMAAAEMQYRTLAVLGLTGVYYRTSAVFP